AATWTVNTLCSQFHCESCRIIAPDFFAISHLGSAVPGEIHSFPTRRSSDLANMKLASPLTYNYTRMFKDALFLRSMGNTFLYLRSEEHTSELQSRFELVCRLLLEKKKYIQRQHRYVALSIYTVIGYLVSSYV